MHSFFNNRQKKSRSTQNFQSLRLLKKYLFLFCATTAAPFAAAALECKVTVSNQWSDGYVVDVDVTNRGTSGANNWAVNLNFTEPSDIANAWNTTLTTTPLRVVARPVAWNTTIAPGQTVAFGFQGSHDGSFVPPSCSLDGGPASTSSLAMSRASSSSLASQPSISSRAKSSSSAANVPVLSGCKPPVDAKPWSDPASWPGSKVPAAGTKVTIPAGQKIQIDQDIDVASLLIDGELYCANRNLNLQAGWIMVHGALQCGCEDQPFAHTLTLTLTDNRTEVSIMDMGTKMLGAMGGGRIELHGAKRNFLWTRLSASATPGASQLYLRDRVDWRVGERIVIASTDFNMNQAEERQIIATDGNRITLDKPLAYLHYGEKHSYTNNRGHSWELDQAAEVALLDRNIVIQGDSQSSTTKFGGHIMSMRGASMKISHARLFRMGQENRLGRYPIHWHMAGNVSGQYARGLSVEKSFNRCITIHGSDYAEVSNNLCYDHMGHGIFLEDGVEQFNVIRNNLGLLTRRPTADKALLISDRSNRGNEPLGPSTYWISNPNNTIEGNISAGSDGSGFWIAPDRNATGESSNVKMVPLNLPLGRFDNNWVHSAAGMAMVLGGTPSHRLDSTGNRVKDASGNFVIDTLEYSPSTPALLTNSGYYKTRARGIWHHGNNSVLDNFVIADNVRGAFFSFVATLKNSIIIGESPNKGTPVSAKEIQLGRSLADPLNGAIAGYILYDGPVTFDNVHFAGLGRNASNVHLFGNNGASLHRVDNRFSRISWDSDTLRVYPENYQPNPTNGQRHAAIIDMDGSVSRRPGSYLLFNEAMNTNASCQRPSERWSSTSFTSCLYQFGVIRFRVDMGTGVGKVDLPPVNIFRQHPLEPVASIIGMTDIVKHWYQLGVIANDSYIYKWVFHEFPKQAWIKLIGLTEADTVILEIPAVPTTHQLFMGSNPLPKAASLSDLRSGAANRQFVGSGNRVYVKINGRSTTEVILKAL